MKCIGPYCKNKATHKEITHEHRTFCGKQCQAQYHKQLALIGQGGFDVISKDSKIEIWIKLALEDVQKMTEVSEEFKTLYDSEDFKQRYIEYDPIRMRNILRNAINNDQPQIFLEWAPLAIEMGVYDPSADDDDAIRWASEFGHTDVVKLLLGDDRVDPSADNDEAILLASYNGHLDVVKLLLQDPDVDPSADNDEAIRWASENGHTDVVNILKQWQMQRDRTKGKQKRVKIVKHSIR